MVFGLIQVHNLEVQRNTKISYRSRTVYEISSQTVPFQTVPELGNYSSPFDREGGDGGTRGGLPTSVMQRDAKRMEGEEEDHHVTWGNMVSEKDLKATCRARGNDYLFLRQFPDIIWARISAFFWRSQKMQITGPKLYRRN